MGVELSRMVPIKRNDQFLNVDKLETSWQILNFSARIKAVMKVPVSVRSSERKNVSDTRSIIFYNTFFIINNLK